MFSRKPTIRIRSRKTTTCSLEMEACRLVSSGAFSNLLPKRTRKRFLKRSERFYDYIRDNICRIIYAIGTTVKMPINLTIFDNHDRIGM